MRLTALGLWLACAAGGQPDAVTSTPKLIRRTQPQYTAEARLARLQGTVQLFVVVGTDGKARDFRLLRPIGLGLDEQAVACVAEWRFEPGVRNGIPRDTSATVEVNFNMPGEDGWRLVRASFRTPEGATRAVLASAPYTILVQPPEAGGATVHLEIDENGVPRQVEGRPFPGRDYSRQAAGIVRRWRFAPAMSEGKPVRSTADFVMATGNWRSPDEDPPPRPGAIKVSWPPVR
jgi:TonB family protein